jgi:hypothetical protein
VSMCLLNSHKPHVDLAVDVFKTRNPALVLSLKDFLTVLPNPKFIEEVLTIALYQLAEIDPDACRWLLRNSSYLEPELDLVEVAMKFASTKLENQGFVLGEDFEFEPKRRLHISDNAKARLMIENSVCDRLLIEEVLQVCD